MMLALLGAADAPNWAPIAVTVAFVLTVLGILALLPDLRKANLSHA